MRTREGMHARLMETNHEVLPVFIETKMAFVKIQDETKVAFYRSLIGYYGTILPHVVM